MSAAKAEGPAEVDAGPAGGAGAENAISLAGRLVSQMEHAVSAAANPSWRKVQAVQDHGSSSVLSTAWRFADGVACCCDRKRRIDFDRSHFAAAMAFAP